MRRRLFVVHKVEQVTLRRCGYDGVSRCSDKKGRTTNELRRPRWCEGWEESC
mgnify:CR=1 FL=1